MNHRSWLRPLGWAFGLLLLSPMPWAHAGADHDRARAAVLSGEILPLPVILERVGKTHPGHVLEVELDREQGRWVYELKVLQVGGTLLKLEIDASSGAPIKQRQERR